MVAGFKSVVRRPWFRKGLVVAGVAVLLLLLLELGMNFWIRASLRQKLIGHPGSDTRLDAKISWLNLYDLLRGQVRRVAIEAENSTINNLVFANLSITSQGFRFDLPALLQHKELKFLEINKTDVAAVISSQALQDYLNYRNPGSDLRIGVAKEKLLFSGVKELWGNKVPYQISGPLKVSGWQRLRFYPERIFISGQAVPKGFLNFINKQVPLEFGVMESWPLQINYLSLTQNRIRLGFKEMNLKKGSG